MEVDLYHECRRAASRRVTSRREQTPKVLACSKITKWWSRMIMNAVDYGTANNVQNRTIEYEVNK